MQSPDHSQIRPGQRNARPSLRVSELTKTFGHGEQTVQAVRGVSFEIWPGEFVAIVGPSGSGKTTLLAMIGGLLTPTSGAIEVRGQDLSTMTRSQLTKFRRQAIGFVFQAGNLLPYLTALENVEVMADITGDRSIRQRSRALLEELGLSTRMNAVATELSGGERQRVAIARALANEPDLMLVDEPTASLDSVRGEQVVKLLAREAHDRSTSAIMVTHDSRIAQIADRILEIRDGQLTEQSRQTENCSARQAAPKHD